MDHLAIILELYTRSYELFKKYSPANAQNQGRQTLWIAYRIAQTYYESGKFDMAAKYDNVFQSVAHSTKTFKVLRAYRKDISPREMGRHARPSALNLVQVRAAAW